MKIPELIRKKRDGKELAREEIDFLISSYTRNKVPDYQFSAFLMAVYFTGMTKEETANLTKAMLYSGETLNLKHLKGSRIDKHSTGGVGDKTSLIVAPVTASAGIYVPMISGRGLGHTGGTLDKLESIPGFKTALTLSKAKAVLKKSGAVLMGQTKEIAPADKLIYALRDVTATVESIPLIAASIMSKKLAEGADGFVFDVKTGNGAFMKEENDSIRLAQTLMEIARSFNKKSVAFISDMNQPLGNYIGNWLEVYESIKILKGEFRNDLLELSLILSGTMIYLGEKAGSIEEGIDISVQQIKSGKALDKFAEIVKLQGGNVKYIYHPEKYPEAKYVETVRSSTEGYLGEIDTFRLGLLSADLGAGRITKDDEIDNSAGIIFIPKIGDRIRKGDIIAELHSSSKKNIKLVKEKFQDILKFSETEVTIPKLIKKIIK